jgi:hypothetical protein
MLYQEEDSRGSINTHQAYCKKLYKYGEIKEPEEPYEATISDERRRDGDW